MGSHQFLAELHKGHEPGRAGRAQSPSFAKATEGRPSAPMRNRGARRSDRPTDGRQRFMESRLFPIELPTDDEPRSGALTLTLSRGERE